MRGESYVGQISLTSPKGCSETSTVCSIANLGVCRVNIFVREFVHSRFDGLQRHDGRNDESTSTSTCHVMVLIRESRVIPLSRLVSQTSHQWPHVLPLLLQIPSMSPLSSMTLLSTRSLPRTRLARTTALSSQPSRTTSRPSTSLSAVAASLHLPLLRPNRRRSTLTSDP